MLIALVGGSGRVGKRVAHYAIERGQKVRSYNRHPERVTIEAVEKIRGDVSDLEGLTNFFKGADVVIFATTVFRADPTRYLRGIRNALVAAKKVGVKMIIFPNHYSTLKIDGQEIKTLYSSPPAYNVMIPVFKEALAVIREEKDLDWLVVTPPVSTPPYHDITGDYIVSEGDDLLIQSKEIGYKSAVLSMEDFASFVLDQALDPTYHRTRVTLCNPYHIWEERKKKGEILAWV